MFTRTTPPPCSKAHFNKSNTFSLLTYLINVTAIARSIEMIQTQLISKKWLYILILAALASLWSCRNICCNDETTYGSGVIVEEIRDVGSFHSVEIRGSCDLFFNQSASQELRIVTDDNILPLILTSVRHGGTLVIDTRSSYSTSAGVKVYVSMVEIRGFTIAGSGTINGDSSFSSQELFLLIAGSGNMTMNVRSHKVSTTIAGSGTIHLAGKADDHNVTIAGSGNLEALDFIVSSYDIQIPGSGECRIHVTDVLNVVIAGSGNVYYRGNPSVINTTIVGSGNVIPLR